MAVCFQSGEELVQKEHLAAVHDQAFERFVANFRSSLGSVKQVWMIASFLQLHSNIEQRNRSVVRAECAVVSRQNVLVPVRLHRTTLVTWERSNSLQQTCMADISTRKIRSLLVGSSLMTSFFSRRSMIA